MPDAVAPETAHATAAPPALKTSRFKVPGEGSSVAISVGTVFGFFVLWFGVTNLGLIKPLFLPSPQAVWPQQRTSQPGRAAAAAPITPA